MADSSKTVEEALRMIHQPEPKFEAAFTPAFDAEALQVGDKGLIAAPRALWELQQVLPGDAIFATDSGANLRTRHPPRIPS